MSIGTKVLFSLRKAVLMGRILSVRGNRVVVRVESASGLSTDYTVLCSEVCS